MMHTYLPAFGCHRLLERRFCLMTGGRKERLVIVERDEIEDQIVDAGMRRPQQRLGAAGALLKLQPDDRGLEARVRRPPRIAPPRADRGRRPLRPSCTGERSRGVRRRPRRACRERKRTQACTTPPAADGPNRGARRRARERVYAMLSNVDATARPSRRVALRRVQMSGRAANRTECRILGNRDARSRRGAGFAPTNATASQHGRCNANH